MGLLKSLFGKNPPAPAAPAKAAPAKAAPSKAAPAKPAAAKPSAPSGGSGGELKSAAVCGDGISVANFEELSRKEYEKASGSPKTTQEWRDAVVKALSEAKDGDATTPYKGDTKITDKQATMFHDVADSLSGKKAGTTAWKSSDGLENLLTGKVSGLEQFGNIDPARMNDEKYSGWTNYYPTHRMPMWRYLKAKGLAYEAFWQHETTASWINKSDKMFYADPSEIPYLVSDVAPVGTFVKITTPDGKHSTYARVLESGTEKAEASLKVWRNLGYNDVTANAAPLSQLKVEVFDGSGGLGKKVKNGAYSYENTYLSDAEIQRAGGVLDKQKADGKAITPINSRDDLLKAEGKPAEPPKQAAADPAVAPQQPGGERLEKGFSTVAIGSNMRLVGYACEDCVHTGGGYVLEGSSSVYVGKYPFARIGDPTNDGLGVVTGDETVFVGGMPTAAELA